MRPTCTEYPFSRGSIHISSGDPYADPIFDSGFLNHEADVAPIRSASSSLMNDSALMFMPAGGLTRRFARSLVAWTLTEVRPIVNGFYIAYI
jgi:hypothetical protein